MLLTIICYMLLAQFPDVASGSRLDQPKARADNGLLTPPMESRRVNRESIPYDEWEDEYTARLKREGDTGFQGGDTQWRQERFQPDSRLRYPAEYFWPVGVKGYTIPTPEDQDLERELRPQFDTWVDQLYKSKPRLFQPILVIGGGSAFAMRREQLQFWLNRYIRCRECWPSEYVKGAKIEARLNDWVQKAVKMGVLNKGATYDVILTPVKKWPGNTPSLTGLVNSIRQGGNWKPLFLTPNLLEYVATPLSLREPSHPEKPNSWPPPPWVVKHYLALGKTTEAWIKAASQRLSGLSWAEYWEHNRCLPGDRSVNDYIINKELRFTTDENYSYHHRVIVCDDSVKGFGPFGAYSKCAEELYYAEIEQAIRDTQSANKTADKWLGVEYEYPSIESLMNKRRSTDKQVINTFVKPIQIEEGCP